MKKKKTYIAPNLIIVKAETLDMIAASPNLLKDKTFDLANKWNEKGRVEEDAELPISAKHYNAWDTWDEGE